LMALRRTVPDGPMKGRPYSASTDPGPSPIHRIPPGRPSPKACRPPESSLFCPSSQRMQPDHSRLRTGSGFLLSNILHLSHGCRGVDDIGRCQPLFEEHAERVADEVTMPFCVRLGHVIEEDVVHGSYNDSQVLYVVAVTERRSSDLSIEGNSRPLW